jgi:hypothetical protein
MASTASFTPLESGDTTDLGTQRILKSCNNFYDTRHPSWRVARVCRPPGARGRRERRAASRCCGPIWRATSFIARGENGGIVDEAKQRHHVGNEVERQRDMRRRTREGDPHMARRVAIKGPEICRSQRQPPAQPGAPTVCLLCGQVELWVVSSPLGPRSSWAPWGQDKTMNSQINAVIIAALAGLTVAVLSQSSSVIPIGYIPPLDIFNPFNLRILGYWVGVLGVLPLIGIAIAIGATARKAGLRNSILTGLGAVVGVSVVTTCAVVAVAIIQSKRELPLRTAGAARDSFVIDASSFCAKMEQPLNKNKASAATINAVCSCYGNSLADITTRTELAYISLHRTFPPSTVEKTNAVSQKCVQLFRGPRDAEGHP